MSILVETGGGAPLFQTDTEVNPTATRTTYTPTYPNTAFDKVHINGDSNLIPQNIRLGKSIFGVEGTACESYTAQNEGNGKIAYIPIPQELTQKITMDSIQALFLISTSQVPSAMLIMSCVLQNENVSNVLFYNGFQQKVTFDVSEWAKGNTWLVIISNDYLQIQAPQNTTSNPFADGKSIYFSVIYK